MPSMKSWPIRSGLKNVNILFMKLGLMKIGQLFISLQANQTTPEPFTFRKLIRVAEFQRNYIYSRKITSLWMSKQIRDLH